MINIKLQSSKEAFVTSLCKDCNFSDYTELLVGNWKGKNGAFSALTFLYFQINWLSLNYNKIKKAELNLYIEKSDDNVNLNLATSSDRFIESIINWNNKPLYKKVYEIKINNIFNEYIKIDITDLVKLWSKKDLINNGMVLYTNKKDSIVTISSSKKEKNPYLEIQYQDY